MEKTQGTKKSVAKVAKMRPPMTARPSGAFCSPPSPRPMAMGIMPMIMANAVMRTGRIRTNPAWSAASRALLPSPNCSFAKETSRMLFAVATPMHMIAPVREGTFNVVWVSRRIQQMPARAPGRAVMMMKGSSQDWKFRSEAHAHDRAREGRNVQRGMGEQKNPTDARKSAGKSGDDDERIEPGLEVHDDEQVGQDNGAKETITEAGEGVLHRFDLAANDDVAAARKVLFDRLDALFDLFGDGAEVASIHGSVHVNHGEDVVVGDFRRAGGRAGSHQISQNLRVRAGEAAADGCVLEGGERIHAVLRSLHRDLIADSVCRIEPEGRSRLKAGTERDEDILRHVASLHAEGLRARAVHVHVKSGFVEGLLDVDVHSAREVANFGGKFLSDGEVARLVHAEELHVNGSRRAEVQNLRDDV